MGRVREAMFFRAELDTPYGGSPFVEKQIVYVAQTADGTQQTLTPAEFAKKFNWKNDPNQVKLGK